MSRLDTWKRLAGEGMVPVHIVTSEIILCHLPSVSLRIKTKGVHEQQLMMRFFPILNYAEQRSLGQQLPRQSEYSLYVQSIQSGFNPPKEFTVTNSFFLGP